MFWTPHSEFKGGCLIDSSDYPFDQHTCTMWFQTIAEPSLILELNLYPKSPLDLSTSLQNFRESMAWTIIGNTSEKIDRPSEHGVVLVYSNRPTLKFTLSARRRPNFKGYLILVPCLVLPLLTMTVFTIPPDRPDRLSLGKLWTMLFWAALIIITLTSWTLSCSHGIVWRLCHSPLAIDWNSTTKSIIGPKAVWVLTLNLTAYKCLLEH